jgi:hypothetical protein
MPTAKHNSTDAAKTQLDKFREAARELECDEDEARFEDQVKRIAEAPKAETPK